MKKIIIINGSGCCGKDTFVYCCSEFCNVINYSSVDRVKEIAKQIGWNGEKTGKDRKFLSDLKKLTTEYCDMSFECMKDEVFAFNTNPYEEILFLHIREPEEIERAKRFFHAETLLIKRDNVEHITSNSSDANVFDYDYDFVIENNGTLEELGMKAYEFVGKVVAHE